MKLSLNNEEWIVEENEFPIQIIEEYSTLELRPELGILERHVSLIKYMLKNFNDSIFVNYGKSNGGYLPIKVNNGFICNYSDNVNKNVLNFNSKITCVNNLNEINIKSLQSIILKIELGHEDNCTDFINLYHPIVLSFNNITHDNYHYYKLSNSNLVLNIPDFLHSQFLNIFKNDLIDNVCYYDNLINICIMVKDAGDGFRKILNDNLPFADYWTILDTGSTDNTVSIIKDVLKNKRFNLYQENFINFRDSRNRCLDLAGNTCKFNIMLDDTYILTGKVRDFLHTIRSDQKGASYNVFIKSGNTTYGSNRITKSANNLRYIYKIHEIIQTDNNITIQIPIDQILINDESNDYMENRTSSRKNLDLQYLLEENTENPNNPRHLYYIAQTYVELKDWDKAMRYFQQRIDHPIEGYKEEITDAYFQIAYIMQNMLNENWEKCEKAYLACYEYDKNRSDALYCIGKYYYDKDNKGVAYNYFKKGFQLGTPINCTSNLRPKIYNELIPYYLTHLCYDFQDYNLGIKSCEKYLRFNYSETIKSFLQIFNLLIISNPKKVKTNSVKPILCFVTVGGYKPWNGSSIDNEGVGGSETFIIEMSRIIAKKSNFKVYVFCNCDKEEVYCNVIYKNINNYVNFINNNIVHTSFISRFSEYIPVTINNDIANIYLHLEDISPTCNIIPINDKIKAIFCMTEWHKNTFVQSFPQFNNKTFVLPNGINIEKFPTNTIKIKNSFIYSSFPNRGLIHLLKMFAKIRAKIPDATLNVFCDTKNIYVQSVAKEEMLEIDLLIKEQSEYITNHGWVSKDMLTSYWLKTEYWLYPCTFAETFCITALEAAASKTLAITTDLAGLQNTVGDRGIMISGHPSGEEWKEEAIEKINNSSKALLIEKNRKWAEEHDWNKIGEDLLVYLNTGINIDNKISIPTIIEPINKIPKILIQTYKNNIIHAHIWNNLNKILENNPNYEYRLITDDIGIELIKKYFDNYTLNAFLKLNLGSAKGDFLRYIAMYIYGGVYLDLDSSIELNLDLFIENNKQFYFFWDHDDNIQQWCFMSVPRNPIILDIIKQVVKRIYNGENNIFLATGPTVVTDVIYNRIHKTNIYDTLKNVSILDKRNTWITNKDYEGGCIIYDNPHFEFKMKGYSDDLMYSHGERYVVTFHQPTPNFYK